MQRRKFIRLSAIGGAAIGFAGIHCHQRHPAFYNILSKPQQLSYICDSNTIREIGMGYRLQFPLEAEADKLMTLLSEDSTGNPVSPASDNLFIQHLINQRVTQDFEKGNMVIVKGWILAVTEARQCALYFVSNQ